MSFYKKYELDRLMADGDAKTFRAVENSTGRVVFLHLFNPSGQPLLAALKAKMGAPPLIEIGEFAGSPYAVTQAIEPFGNLRDWIALHVTASNPLSGDSSPNLAALLDVPLAKSPQRPPPVPLVVDHALPERAAPAPPISATPTPAARGLLTDGPGEFTKLFEEPMSPAPPKVPASSGLVSEAPGEFTRLFHAPEPPAPAPAAPSEAPSEFTRLFREPLSSPPPPAAASGGLVAEAPGEFTKLFHDPASTPLPPEPTWQPPPPKVDPVSSGPAAPKPQVPEDARAPLWPPPSPDSAAADTGQFSRLFGSRMSGESIDIEKEHLSAARSATPESRPFQQAGEFTRMFGPQHGAPGAAAPPAGDPARSLNTSTRLTSASGMFGSPEEMAKVAANALAGPKPPDAGPGEYTRLFDSPKKPEEASPPANPQAPQAEAAPPKKSHRDLIVILVAVAVLVVLIVVAILLRKH